jgi:hypothetical protein
MIVCLAERLVLPRIWKIEEEKCLLESECNSRSSDGTGKTL